MKSTIQFFTHRAAIIAVASVLAVSAMSATVAHADTGIGTGVGVFIGQDGNAFVHGATVTATSTSGVTATTNVAGTVTTWHVNASSTTRFGKLGTDISALMNVAIGDVVSFWGKLSGTGSSLTVDAQALKDKTFKAASSTATMIKHHSWKHFNGFKFHGHAFFNFGKGD